MDSKKMSQVRDKVIEMTKKYGTLDIVSKLIGGLLLTLMIVFWVGKTKNNLLKSNINKLKTTYSDFPLISNINTSNKLYGHKLRDYYVKTAYNCCATGSFKHDWVSPEALKTCIRQGVRCLDFQIYSLDNQPVIAVSADTDYSVKGSYNSIPFSQAMSTIANYAFSGSTCPCPGDPLILHFRIMTNNMPILDKMAQDLKITLSRRLLGRAFSYENNGENIGSVPLKDLNGKVVIVVDKSKANPSDTDLDEYVNLTSNSIFMRTLRYQDVKFTPDMQELIEYNKKNITMCIPDLGQHPRNPSPLLAMKYGCQFVAMSFQKVDANMEYYNKFFNDEGSAFALKPESLRYIPIVIEVPKPPPKEYSYKQRDVKSDYYSFKM
ncbi:MAG: hypothetical protein CMH58_03975 [Myxococcales bacterium]|nr:hypothetical protein [Myxococcales bacterium]|tara:strand:- start:1853 stop:2986 length:1134 start_codon:yes stop_codon:yes gene_type:complete